MKTTDNEKLLISHPISGKILVLELWAKMLLGNQIGGFFNILIFLIYLKKEVNDAVYFDMHINIKVFYKLKLSFWVCVAGYAQNTQNKKFAYLCNISRKNIGDEVDFGRQIKVKVFYKLIVSIWVCVARHAQSTRNSKFAIYIKQNAKDEVDFLPADKHQMILQIDAIILGLWGQACPNYRK